MRINRLLSAILMMAIAIGAFAQNSTLTPYSRYGYGILNDNASAAQRAMGGVGYAMSSGKQANVMNPASYASIDSLTFLFDMGVDFKSMWASENTVSENNFTGGLDYLTMAFPLSKRVGGSIGILPYASTGYSFMGTVTNGLVSRTGDGDISLIYAGVGVEPLRNLYVGANIAYMFGTITNDVYASATTGGVSLFQRYMRIRDWKLDLGVQYVKRLNKTDKFTVGVTYTPGKSFHGETYGVYYDYSLTDVVPDTTGYTKLGGKYSMPATWGVGLNYSKGNSFMVEADFTYQPWEKAKFATIENFEGSEFTNRWKAAAGVQFVPRVRGSYFQRVQYRLGAYYNHDYLMVRGNNVVEMGATLGFGFPVPIFKTTVNLGFEYKHRQANPVALIKEDYFNITLGINFNEMWFRKSKIY